MLSGLNPSHKLYPFIHSSINVFILSFIYPFIHSFFQCYPPFIHLPAHLFIYSSIHSFIHSFFHPFNTSFLYQSIHPFTSSFTHLLIHSLTHSRLPTESLTPCVLLLLTDVPPFLGCLAKLASFSSGGKVLLFLRPSSASCKFKYRT